MIGQYRPGDSWLHRLPAGVALAGTLLVVTALGLWPQTGPVPRWTAVVVAALGVLVVGLSARLPLGGVARSLRPLLVLALVLAAVQVWLHGVRPAVEVVGQIVVAVLLGQVVMMTTRVSDMVRTVSGIAVPLRPFGVERERLELVLALTVGCIPRIGAALTTAREAAQARGVRPRLRVVVPSLLVAVVREADQLGEALAARGL